MCREHGWRSKVCPECLFHQTGDFDRQSNHRELDRTLGSRAIQTALCLIDARPWQKAHVEAIAKASGYPAALTVARQWQDPMPLPVVICNF